LIEEFRLVVQHLDSQAFTFSAVYMYGGEFAAFYTLHDALARKAQDSGGFLHGHVALWDVFDEEGSQLLGHSDLPGRTGGELFASDEAVG
jgi:hypothetical protein